MVRNYNAKQVILAVGGVPIGGYADGTFIKVSRASDSFEKVTGVDGITSRSKTNDKSGELVITLAQTSPSNDVLQAFALADEKTSSGVVPVLVKDIGSTTVIFSALGWVRKPPDIEFGKQVSNREWTFDLSDLEIWNGGSIG